MSIRDLLMATPEGSALSIECDDDDIVTVIKPLSEISKDAIDNDKILFISLVDRPGSMVFASELEHEHFPPDEAVNDMFGMYFTKWEMMVIAIISVPKNIEEIAKGIAVKHGLVPKQGLIMSCMSSDGMNQFPLHGENVFIFENQPGHPIYGASGGTIQDLNHDELSKAMKYQKKTLDRINKT